MSLAAQLLDASRENGARLTAAESCTGGMIAAAITDPAGASDVFDYGFVTYSNTAKQDLLGVLSETLDAFGAVSEEVAREMAEGALSRARATVAVSVTGIAGPGGTDTKPEGRVCFGLSGPNGTRTETVEFGSLGRENVRAATRDHALTLLIDAVRALP